MKNFLTKKNRYQKDAPIGRRAFSLVEVMITMLIFSLVSTMILSAFFDVFQARRKTKAIQQNVEDARYAMEAMAKVLRTSTVFGGLGTNSIAIFDYSQRKCLRYGLDGGATGNLVVVESTPICRRNRSDGKIWVSGCNNFPALSTGKKMTTTLVNRLSFGGTPSSFSPPKELGQVTIGFEICYDNSGQDCALDTATIQTSVSLLDYSYVKDGRSTETDPIACPST